MSRETISLGNPFQKVIIRVPELNGIVRTKYSTAIRKIRKENTNHENGKTRILARSPKNPESPIGIKRSPRRQNYVPTTLI